MSLNLNANTSINFNKTDVPLKRCDHTGVTAKYDIELSCTWAMPPILYPKFSMSTLQIWVLKSGILKIVFLLCEHVTKANIGGAKMANNRHTVNSFKAIGRQMGYHDTVVSRLVRKKTKPTPWKIRKTSCNVAAWRQSTASLGQTDVIRNHPCSEKTMVTK